MSVGSEFHRSDAATGKERRLTVVSRNGGTSSYCDDGRDVKVSGLRILVSRLLKNNRSILDLGLDESLDIFETSINDNAHLTIGYILSVSVFGKMSR